MDQKTRRRIREEYREMQRAETQRTLTMLAVAVTLAVIIAVAYSFLSG